MIGVERFTLDVEVDESNLDQAKQEFDQLFQQVDPSAESQPGEIVGLPSLSVDAIAVPTPEDGESRVTVLFEGDQEYLINCQSTPEGRPEIEAACDLVLETLTVSAERDTTTTESPRTTTSESPSTTESAVGLIPVELRLGDCFNDSAHVTAEVDEMTVVDCGSPHDAEVFGVPNLPGKPAAPYPGDDEVDRLSYELCLGEFASYVGIDFLDSAWEFGYLRPTEESWRKYDDRLVVCTLNDPQVQQNRRLETEQPDLSVARHPLQGCLGPRWARLTTYNCRSDAGTGSGPADGTSVGLEAQEGCSVPTDPIGIPWNGRIALVVSKILCQVRALDAARYLVKSNALDVEVVGLAWSPR
jgi:hypothetical protein